MHWEYFFCALFLGLIFQSFQKFNFFVNSGLSLKQLRLLFLIKIIGALTAAYYFIHSNNPDYLNFSNEGFVQYKILINKPYSFFDDVKTDLNNYGWGGIFNSSHSFWANLRFNFIYKLIAILNLLSHGNFYLNSMIFSSLVFLGNISLFRIFDGIYENQKFKILVACFFIPSMTLYTSCVHKDGIVFLCVSMIAYYLFFLNAKHIAVLKSLLLIFLFISILFILRNYIVLALIPSILLSLFYRYIKTKKLFIIVLTYFLMIVCFFLIPFSNSNLAEIIINRKSDFQMISKGNTDIALNDLKPNLISFIYNLPQAFNHSFLKPYLFEFNSLTVNLSSLEILMYEFLMLLFIFYRKNNSEKLHWFNVFGICFMFHLFLFIGYTIPNIGAIVRYRSIFWIFLIVPVLCNIDEKKMRWLPHFLKR